MGSGCVNRERRGGRRQGGSYQVRVTFNGAEEEDDDVPEPEPVPEPLAEAEAGVGRILTSIFIVCPSSSFKSSHTYKWALGSNPTVVVAG